MNYDRIHHVRPRCSSLWVAKKKKLQLMPLEGVGCEKDGRCLLRTASGAICLPSTAAVVPPQQLVMGSDDGLSKVKDPILNAIKWLKSRSPREKTAMGAVAGILVRFLQHVRGGLGGVLSYLPTVHAAGGCAAAAGHVTDGAACPCKLCSAASHYRRPDLTGSRYKRRQPASSNAQLS